jgi:aminoglycoside phosphotransferase (APT) family kinase protein
MAAGPGDELLADLVGAAGLAAVVSSERLTGRGFDHEILAATLTDGGRVVLRRKLEPPFVDDTLRARLLEGLGLPIPARLAGNLQGTLDEFVPGSLLGDLIEAGTCGDAEWRAVGEAFRRVHNVTFPADLRGEVTPGGEVVLRPVDALAEMHGWIDEIAPRLRLAHPRSAQALSRLHDLAGRCAAPLREAKTYLLHGDVNMWNIILGETRATLIDWDEPRVGDAAMQVALLDKHAHLFDGQGLHSAFYEGYGRRPAEPNFSLHRIVQALRWMADDWTGWFEGADVPEELRVRTRRWWRSLLAWADDIDDHTTRLEQVVAAAGL